MAAHILNTNLAGFLFGFALFIIFVLVLTVPVLLPVWLAHRWYATHRLRDFPWRTRRVLLGVALLWSAMFSKLPTWAKVVACTATLSLLVILFLFWVQGGLYADSMESITIHDLRRGRFTWLYEGCEQPPDAGKHIGASGAWTIATYTNTHAIAGRNYHGLFAMTPSADTNTYLITTTDEILVLSKSRPPRLLKRAGEW